LAANNMSPTCPFFVIKDLPKATHGGGELRQQQLETSKDTAA